MAAVGNLNIQLTAGIGNFVSNMDAAAKKMTSFADSMTSSIVKGNIITAVITKIGSAMSSAVSSGFNKIIESFTKLDDVGDIASRLGVTSNALINLSSIAKDAGVSQETLVNSMTKLQRNIVAAAGGAKQQAEAFAKLGLSAKELAALPIDEAMLKVGDALKEVSNQNQRAAIAMDVFGKSGAQLTGFLEQGSAAINETAASLDNLGGKITDLDSTNIDTANSSINFLVEAFDKMFMKLAAQIAPIVTEVTEYIIKFAEENDVLGTVIQAAWTTVYTVIGIGQTVWRGLVITWNVLKLAWYGLELIIVGGCYAIVKAANDVAKFFGMETDFKLLEDLGKDLDNTLKKIEDTKKAIGQQWEEPTINWADTVAKAVENTENKGIKKAQDAIKKRAEQQKANAEPLLTEPKEAKVKKSKSKELQDRTNNSKIELQATGVVLKGSFEELLIGKKQKEDELIKIQTAQLNALNEANKLLRKGFTVEATI